MVCSYGCHQARPMFRAETCQPVKVHLEKIKMKRAHALKETKRSDTQIMAMSQRQSRVLTGSLCFCQHWKELLDRWCFCRGGPTADKSGCKQISERANRLICFVASNEVYTYRYNKLYETDHPSCTIHLQYQPFHCRWKSPLNELVCFHQFYLVIYLRTSHDKDGPWGGESDCQTVAEPAEIRHVNAELTTCLNIYGTACASNARPVP